MAAKRIRLYGDPVLRERSEPVEEIDDGIKDLVEGLVAAVDEAEGLGLAAPQIGVSRRVIVVVELDSDGRRKHHVVINPEIVSACGEDVNEEGCLSIPGIYADVERPHAVTIQAWNERGRPFTLDAEGLLARVIQHELDHLNGVLFLDYLDDKKRKRLVQQYDRKAGAGSASAR